MKQPKEFENHGRLPGFTVLEILVVIAITSILLSLAIPAFQQYLKRGYRAEAVHSILSIVSCQERIRASTGYYDTTRCSEGLDSTRYTFSISPDAETRALEYVVMAMPAEHDDMDYCGNLNIDQAGTRTISGDANHVSACWGGR